MMHEEIKNLVELARIAWPLKESDINSLYAVDQNGNVVLTGSAINIQKLINITEKLPIDELIPTHSENITYPIDENNYLIRKDNFTLLFVRGFDQFKDSDLLIVHEIMKARTKLIYYYANLAFNPDKFSEEPLQIVAKENFWS